jgi:hypothetical protein
MFNNMRFTVKVKLPIKVKPLILRDREQLRDKNTLKDNILLSKIMDYGLFIFYVV